ncbi:acid phosphatase type 7 isoform X2 [Aplysia californica]|uniref:Acid phosphatase type 7 isoform X2 n=1 Tax=Aplysia californica TaxID=6500 RepID=A0ABM0JLF4_APLCA|nr:acid phosphatase type 7 isoform X2 [Aplysia californica]
MSNTAESGTFFFKTPKAPTVNSSSELQMLVLSDLSTTSGAIPKLVQEAQRGGKYSAILHTGNIAVNMSTDGGKNADKYFTRLEPAFARVPYMTAPGEAEIEDDLYTHYLHRLSMPQSEWPITLDRMWYSVDIGPVHLISYSTDVFYTSEGKYASVQHDWLIKDLKVANENREKVPWVVAFGHEPMYCSYEDPDLACNKKTSLVKTGLEDIFYHYGADIILQSYGKAYERSFPMYKNVAVADNYTNPLAPVLIVNGGATTWQEEYNFTKSAPGWVAKRITNFTEPSYGRLRIFNSTVAKYEQVAFEDGSVLDTFSIFQEKHGQFSTESLSPNITAEINQEILDAGGKPGVLNIDEIGHTDIKSKITEMLKGDNKTRLIIGVSAGSFIIAVLVIICIVRRVRRRRRVTRRWEQMDINYGKKFYSKAPDKDEDNDFEIDMSEGTEPTRKLLEADD